VQSYRQKIETELLRVDDEKFQRIVRQIIHARTSKELEVFDALGSSAKTGKTRKGTPDLYYKLAREQLVFVDITTQQAGLFPTPKKPQGGKIFEDLKKCKERADKGIQIAKIIYCFLEKMTPEHFTAFSMFCNTLTTTKSNSFEAWNIDWFVLELSTKYQNIVETELGIPPVFGAAQELDTAIKSNKFDVSQDHVFMHRDAELKEIEGALLERNIVFLYGKAGCGKTRLAIEIAKKLQKQKDYGQSYIFKNQTSKAISDLGLSDTGNKHVVMLDDVNRLPFWMDFITYVQAHKNIFIIATVREYAYNDLSKTMIQHRIDGIISSIEIKPLEDQKLRDVVRSFIGNPTPETLETIMSVSKENARFAIMCAEIVKSTQKVPKTLEEILDNYFIEVNEDLKQLSESKPITERDTTITRDIEKQYKIVLAVVSLLQRVLISEDYKLRFQEKNAIQALAELGIDKETYLDAVEYWEQREIINIPFKDKVAEIADQILANYLFYKIVFVDKHVEFVALFNILFPHYTKRFIDMMKSLFPIYEKSRELIKNDINTLWDETYSKGDHPIVFMQRFWQMFPEKTIAHIKENFGTSPAYETFIEILGAFESTEYEGQALEFLLLVLEANTENSSVAAKVHQALKSYIFSPHAYKKGFETQLTIINEITKHIGSDKHSVYFQLLDEMAKELLGYSMKAFKQMRASFYHISVNVVADKNLFQVRKLILQNILTTLKSGKTPFRELAKSLHSLGWDSPNKPTGKDLLDLMALDKKNLLELLGTFIVETFNEKIFIRKMLNRVCVHGDKDYERIIKRFSKGDKYFVAYCIMHDKVPYDLKSNNWEKREKKKDQNCIDALKSLGDLDSCIEYLVSIYGDGHVEDHTMAKPLNLFFEFAHTELKQDYAAILASYIEKCTDIHFFPHLPIQKALETYPFNEVYDIIKNSDLVYKNVWLLYLFIFVKEDDITGDIYNECLSLIEHMYINGNYRSSQPYYEALHSFTNFEQYRQGFYATIFKKYYARLKEVGDDNSLHCSCGFIEWTYKCKTYIKPPNYEELERIFDESEWKTFCDVYFEMAKKRGVAVSTTEKFLKYICGKDTENLYKFYDVFLQDRNDYLPQGIINEFPNVGENLFKIVKRHIDNDGWLRRLTGRLRSEGIFTGISDDEFEIFSRLFINEFKQKEPEQKQSLFTRLPMIKKFFKKKTIKHKSDILNFIGEEIADLKVEKQIIFYKVAVELLSIERFAEMRIFTMPTSWSGSRIPLMQNEIETIKKLLPLIEDKPQYISLIEKRKKEIEEWIEYEQIAELGEDIWS